jgi:tetratricopeptide (TPR) repeat protein
MSVTISVALSQDPHFELRCGDRTRRVQWSEVEALASGADRDYFGDDQELPRLTALGRSLYQWLDGPEGWLKTAMAAEETMLVLDLVAAFHSRTDPLLRKLAHLPWELLHDGSSFLAERGITPVRLMRSGPAAAGPANRPLRLLFMATSPEDVQPILDYEREEATILKATEKQPIDLVVEESGSVAQLQNLVASFGQGYFDVFHISGHGTIEDDTPLFLTEDDHGGEEYTTAEQLAEAFGHRWPRLLFLSGCHTAEAPSRGMIPSMAHSLVNAGAGAVLGWARPVYDTTGIFAAERLYHQLSTGESIVDAVAATRREMLREFLAHPDRPHCSDWHLLRIYQGVRDIPALVTPLRTPRREQIRRRPAESEFLDADGKVKVAKDTGFFGRRRELQRSLQALADPGDYYGVYLYGIGGYGKSTIAARLCRRHEALNPDSRRVVLVGPVDEFRLRQRLSDKLGDQPQAVEILNQPIAFKHQLKRLFETYRLLLVLDDFEQNVPAANVEDGSLRLSPDAWNVMEALCFALEEAAGASRLIVTCRYQGPLPGHRLLVEQLSRMQPADIDKKVSAIVGDDQRNQDRERKTVQAADGNPRLLEWLLQLTDVLDDEFLERLGGTVARFRENLLAEKLIGALDEDEKKALARMTLFQLPVPEALVTEMAHGASVQRAMRLGLLEKQGSQEENLYRVTTVLEPLVLSVLSESEWTEARKRAVRKLYELWWDVPEPPPEPHALEVVRLALKAGEQELAVVPAHAIATHWYNHSRFLEAAALCRFVLEDFDDYRILGAIARAEQVLGETEAARDHFTRALMLCPASCEDRKATILHNLAGLEASVSNFSRALELWKQSQVINERIGDLQSKARTLHSMATLIGKQGDIRQAFELMEESLSIKERFGDVQGIAPTLHNMAVMVAQQGDIPRAVELWHRSLKIQERIGDMLGKAATLQQMGEVIAKQGDITRAFELWQQSLEIQGRIGDVAGESGTLQQMARVVAQQGDIPRALELWQQSLEISERIGDRKATSDTLYDMAGAFAQQGSIPRALELWQQSLEIAERIGDLQGSGTTLGQMAWAAGRSGQAELRDKLNVRAAEALGAARAYVNLVVVLVNLGVTAVQGRELFAAQVAWLVLRVQAPADNSAQGLRLLFDLVPRGDPLEGLLGAAAKILVNQRGEGHPKRQEVRELAAKMLAVAKQNAGGALDPRLSDPDYVLPELSLRLEELIGDRWVFDRTPLLT